MHPSFNSNNPTEIASTMMAIPTSTPPGYAAALLQRHDLDALERDAAKMIQELFLRDDAAPFAEACDAWREYQDAKACLEALEVAVRQELAPTIELARRDSVADGASIATSAVLAHLMAKHPAALMRVSSAIGRVLALRTVHAPATKGN